MHYYKSFKNHTAELIAHVLNHYKWDYKLEF